MIELNSVAQGLKAADAMLKAARISMIKAQPICPGKYIILFSGVIGDVKSAVKAGELASGMNLIDSIIIPRVHESLMPAITGCTEIEGVQALGVIESFSIAQALYSADQAAKAANIDLVEIRLGVGIGGKAFVILTGSISQVEAAIKSGCQSRGEDTLILQSAVIPSPDKALIKAVLQQ